MLQLYMCIGYDLRTVVVPPFVPCCLWGIILKVFILLCFLVSPNLTKEVHNMFFTLYKSNCKTNTSTK